MHRAWLLLLLALFAGCYPLRETEVFYTPSTEKIYPPLAKDAPVPVLTEPPAWPHKQIGRFALQSSRGYKFLYRALLHNARRQGADAVVLRKVVFDQRRTLNYVPPSWRTIPQTNVFYQTVKNDKGEWVTVPQAYTVFVPYFVPARTFVNDVQWIDMDAVMVVRRDKPSLAPAPEYR